MTQLFEKHPTAPGGGGAAAARSRIPPALLAALVLLAPVSAAGQEVQVVEHRLDNGMTLLLVPRPGDPNVAAGWVAKVGSVNERPGITGVAHLFEHMMFKGTRTIGTRDIEEDLRIIDALDALKAELQVEEAHLIEQHRLGVIDDPRSPDVRSPRHRELLEEFDALLARQSELLIKEDFSRIYTGQGASAMNAGTSYDFTIYFVNVPANKLELWFWLESDRLLDPVFREFYAERDVVHEERRLRTDSTPIGKFREQFDAMFWESSPYSWPVIGWPSDIEGVTREEALAFFDVYYAPNNIAATLVGGLRPGRGHRARRALLRSAAARRAPRPRAAHARDAAARREAHGGVRRDQSAGGDPLPHGAGRPRGRAGARRARPVAQRAHGAPVPGPRRGAAGGHGCVGRAGRVQVRGDVRAARRGPAGPHAGGGGAGALRRARAAQDRAGGGARAAEGEEPERRQHLPRPGGQLSN